MICAFSLRGTEISVMDASLVIDVCDFLVSAFNYLPFILFMVGLGVLSL